MSDELPEFKKVVLPGDEEPASDTEPAADEESAVPATTSSDGGNEPPGEPPTEPVDDPDADPSADAADDDASDSDDDSEENKSEPEGRMGVLQHLRELRTCLTRVVLAVLVGFLPCYAVATQLFAILMKPMNDAMNRATGSGGIELTPEFFKALKESLAATMAQKGPEYVEQLDYFVAALEKTLDKVVINTGQFIYTYPPEAFFAEVKVAFVAGFFLVSPYIFYQVWKFVAPALYSHERRWIWPIAFVSAAFFVTGGCFGYFVVFPVGFDFFAQFSSDAISFMPKLSEYLGFSLKLLIAFGLAFELPVFIFFLAVMGMVTGPWLVAKSKYFILVAFIIGAMLTPPDPVSQSLMAGPLILLYGLGVIIAFIFGKKKPKAEPENDTPDDTPDGAKNDPKDDTKENAKDGEKAGEKEGQDEPASASKAAKAAEGQSSQKDSPGQKDNK